MGPPAPAAPDPDQTDQASRLAWPVPLALGLMGGVLLAAGNLWGAGLLLLALGLLGLGLTGRHWRRGTGWRVAGWGVAVLLLAGVGGGRYQAWQAAPDPLARYLGGNLTLHGHWDGTALTLRDPPARVALSPRPVLAPGQLSVAGVLVAPDGQRVPGGFDSRAWLRGQGVRAVLAGAAVRSSVPDGGFRGWFRRGLLAGLPPREAALQLAVQLGDKTSLSRQGWEGEASGDAQAGRVQDSFAAAGLSHLMALSGQNVALLIGLLTLVFVRTPTGWLGDWHLKMGDWRLKLGGWHLGLARYPLTMLALLGYLWLVGPSPSITRAVGMGELALLGVWLGRGRLDVYGVTALSAIGGLLAQPAWLFDLGFQLSYLAVLGLSLTPLLARSVPPGWPRPLRWTALALLASFLAQAATLPLIAGSFGALPLVSLPANLLAEGVMALLVPLGLVAGLLGPLAAPLNLLNRVLLDALLAVAHTFGGWPTLPWGLVSGAGVAAYAVTGAAAVLVLARQVRPWVLPLASTLAILGTALPARLWPPQELVYLDIGQGDSTLIRARGLRVLVDGGGTPRGDYDVGAGLVLPALRAVGVYGLDAVVATHADADHIEGLISVLEHLPVGELWLGERKTADPLMAQLLAVAARRRVPVRELRRGDVVRAGDLTLTVLWPRGAPFSAADNENSVVLRLDAPGFSTALLGDTPDPLEEWLGLGPLSVLKTAHHGSRFSTSAALLAQARPQDAVISVGRNTYGHPNPQLLERLQAAGVRVWRTDQEGTIRWPLP